MYPTSLEQLLTGIYVLEVSLIGLFLTVRDSHDFFAGIGQVVLVVFATIATLIYHVILRRSFTPVMKHLPAAKGYDCHEVKSENQSLTMEGIGRISSIRFRLWEHLARSLRPVSRLSPDLKASIHKLATNQTREQSQRCRSGTSSIRRTPIVSIPQDILGLKAEEELQAKKLIKDLQFSTGLAKFDDRGRLLMSRAVDSNDEDWLDDL